MGRHDTFGKERFIREQSRGPSRSALSGQVLLVSGVADIQPCAHWTDPRNVSRMVTVVGSSPSSPAALGLSDIIETGARLTYRAGGVSRIDEWAWNPAGWRRTLLASEVLVEARRVLLTSDQGEQDVTVGAGVAVGSGVRDGCVLTIRDGVPEAGVGGAATRVARLPHGTQEFKLWQNPSAGSFELGFQQADGTFTAYYTGLGLSELVDWVAVGSVNAVRYADTGADTGALAWIETRG